MVVTCAQKDAWSVVWFISSCTFAGMVISFRQRLQDAIVGPDTTKYEQMDPHITVQSRPYAARVGYEHGHWRQL